MIRRKPDAVPPRAIALWIVCLSLLAVGARNFEQGGIGVDGPLYALMARGAVRTGQWFLLQGTVPHFMPFADHPHLGIWLLGVVFSILPAADWSARIVGIVFYAGFLGVFFRFLRLTLGLRHAVVTVLLLWTFYRFSNYFSNVVLDPGALFFGASAIFLLYEGLEKRKTWLCAVAGLSLALCFMVKGLTVLGFLPAVAFAAGVAVRRNRKVMPKMVRGLAAFAVAAVAVVAIYLLLVRWQAPGLISRYWANQWTNRFARQWDWSLLLGWRFWGSLCRDTHYLLLAAIPLAIWRRPVGIQWLPWILILSFGILYAPADRVGIHYWVALLPWPAWAFVQAWPLTDRWSVAKVMKGSGVAAVVLVLVAQFIPVRVHGREDPEVVWLQSRIAQGLVDRLIVDMRPEYENFTYIDKYTWYADRPIFPVSKGQPVPLATPKAGYLLYYPTPENLEQTRARGWCPDAVFSERAVLLPCES